MYIAIDLVEARTSTGRVIDVCPQVRVEAEVDEGWDISKLHDLKHDLHKMLSKRLPACLGVQHGE